MSTKDVKSSCLRRLIYSMCSECSPPARTRAWSRARHRSLDDVTGQWMQR